jgi:hypothetical protein
VLKLTPTTNDALHGLNGSGPAHHAQANAQVIPITDNSLVSLPGDHVEVVQEQKVNQAPVLAPKQSFKVALVGTAPSSRMLAPFNDPSWKIWACSPGNMNVLPRVDAWFEIHGNMLWPENKHYGENYLRWLAQQTFPVYMQNKDFIPHAIPIPKDELVEEFGPYFFTSSFSWMMAYAMREGASEIALYGIDMASRDEYILQRPGAYHFFNEARKRGVKISAPNESDIMQPPMLYGFSEVTPIGRKICAREVEIKERLNQARQQRDSLSAQITYLEGALEDVDYWKNIWGGAQSHPFIATPKEQE